MDRKRIPQNLEDDFRIREFIKKKLAKVGAEKIEIERFPGKIKVIISSSRPGLIIGRGGEGVERLRKELGKISSAKEIRLEIIEIKNPFLSAAFAAEWSVSQIEKRIPYRRVLRQTLEKISLQKGVKGCRIEVAGRLDGSEIARREWLKKGRLPRQTLRADIDYARAEAFCTYGTVGVKVWIYKGEKFE
ncbi:MAG: small subunit ribosomal protein S3 [Parcubacteria group bacterium Gr01-1014_30]|nr:MAG: small subunit ribosomal protein S3 [Parcubacteria group bacterium Gr01-1014_30]